MVKHEMLSVVPREALVTPHAPVRITGRPPYPVLMLLRIHFLQQWFSLADVGVVDAVTGYGVMAG